MTFTRGFEAFERLGAGREQLANQSKYSEAVGIT